MSANIHDVAKLAGVSPRTVSNVVNDFVHVRPATREKVLRAIEELNYRPNISARRLRQGRTRIIGFAVPELSQPYFAELCELVEFVAQEHGYTVIATQTGGEKEAERKFLREFSSHIVDGLIFSPMGLQKPELYKTPPSVPTVLIGEQISSSKYTTIAIDNVRAAQDLTRHLIEQGNTRIATLGAYHTDLYRSSRLRLEGYRNALDEAGLIFDPELVLYTDQFSRTAGREGVTAALQQGIEFDSIVCFTDVLAFGALRALADAGKRVPTDVALAAIDDLQEAEFSVPSLTSIRPNKRRIAEQAVNSLLELIASNEQEPQNIEIDYSLVIRESSISA